MTFVLVARQQVSLFVEIYDHNHDPSHKVFNSLSNRIVDDVLL